MYRCRKLMCMEGEGPKREGGIELDWEELLPTTKKGHDDDDDDDDDEEPPQLVVVPAAKSQLTAMQMDADQQNELRNLSDKALDETIARMHREFPRLVQTLKDGGVKYKANLKRHEDELERRQRLRLKKNDDGCKKPIDLHNPNCNGLSDDVRHGAPSSVSSAPSMFASRFFNKLERKTDSTTGKAFEKELSTFNICGRLKMKPSRQSSCKDGQKRGRESPFRSPGSPFLNVDGGQKDRKNAPQVQTSNCLKRIKGETVVLDDEEELEVVQRKSQANEVAECKKNRIFYPSRDDPEAVEICYSDMDCLAPEGYLSSTIMNFYIRYLQVQGLASKTIDRERYSYHFFNTYFYEKLKEAVVKKNINENSFSKLRRWWKGVNIFEKAYILVPIHESLHWSLVIICIPDKEDRSGPILLHLDSLALHCSKSIFGNIKSFLVEEWNFLNAREAPLDLPIADNIWEHLPRRIDEKRIEVPQQRNEYDCGLFVLFFMKRFIEEAPERLKKKDLAMFGKKWFNPEEASSLRQYIRSLLEENFKNACKEKQVLHL